MSSGSRPDDQGRSFCRRTAHVSPHPGSTLHPGQADPSPIIPFIPLRKPHQHPRTPPESEQQHRSTCHHGPPAGLVVSAMFSVSRIIYSVPTVLLVSRGS